MFIGDYEFERDPALAQTLRQFVYNINTNAKLENAPVFTISGPCALVVSSRKFGVGQIKHNFMGGEELRLSEATVERYIERPGYRVSLIFAPVKMGLAAQIAKVVVPLADAPEKIDGVERFVQIASLGSEGSKMLAQEREEAELAAARLPSVEDVRASSAWGGW